MPRLFLGNFDFEHRLADPNRQLPAKLERINAELATSWLAIADEGDYLWTPQPIEAAFFEQAVRDGLPRVIPVVSFNDVPRGVECIPWGWTNDIRQLCDQRGWVRNDPPHEAVRTANSRRFSAALEGEWLCGLDFAGEATSLQEVERLLSFHGRDARWVIKAEFGMSGRERILGCGPPTEADRNWIERRLASDGVVFFEPWVEQIQEVGIQLDIPREGEPRLIDVVPMAVDDRGQYAGSWISPGEPAWTDHTIPVPSSIDDETLRAASRLQERGYFGPVGIDAMCWSRSDGTVQWRLFQDINARWTMGRLSLGFRRRLELQHRVGYWRHGSRKKMSVPLHQAFSLHRERFKKFLRLGNQNFTKELWDVFHVVCTRDEPFSFAQIADEFLFRPEGQNISRDSVFRSILLMYQAGLVYEKYDADGWETGEYALIAAEQWPTSPAVVGGLPTEHASVLVFV